jgi:sugar transferase (PEP-CTERM/EpsH1 system associated)
MDNGVDLAFFAPRDIASPFSGGPNIVFTGTMDYWPNMDAVAWFVAGIWPRLRATWPDSVFTIVGANPAPAVLRLADTHGVRVTGRVADVRPYLAHADLVVAPLRIARGIQNKVLEAMAMGRPVLATPEAFAGLRAEPGRDLLVGAGADHFATLANEVLAGRHPGLGAAARAAVSGSYAWDTTLAGLDDLFAPRARSRRLAEALT